MNIEVVNKSTNQNLMGSTYSAPKNVPLSQRMSELSARAQQLRYNLSIQMTAVGLGGVKDVCFECYVSGASVVMGKCSHFPQFINYKLITTANTFAKYCYYLRLHNNKADIQKIFSNAALLDNCRKFHFIEGCHNLIIQPDWPSSILSSTHSVISAVILAEKCNIKEQQKFIAQLCRHNFVLTDADRDMAGLIFYENIPISNVIMFLKSEIEKDIKWYIVYWLMRLYKVQFCPLC
jgi:hypothetical protein